MLIYKNKIHTKNNQPYCIIVISGNSYPVFKMFICCNSFSSSASSSVRGEGRSLLVHLAWICIAFKSVSWCQLVQAQSGKLLAQKNKFFIGREGDSFKDLYVYMANNKPRNPGRNLFLYSHFTSLRWAVVLAGWVFAVLCWTYQWTTALF